MSDTEGRQLKESTQATLAPLLEVLRSNPALREVRPAMFYLDGSDFVHFHGEDEDVVADVLLTKGRVRMPVATQAAQAELLERIDDRLKSLDSRVRDHQRRGRRNRL